MSKSDLSEDIKGLIKPVTDTTNDDTTLLIRGGPLIGGSITISGGGWYSKSNIKDLSNTICFEDEQEQEEHEAIYSIERINYEFGSDFILDRLNLENIILYLKNKQNEIKE